MNKNNNKKNFERRRNLFWSGFNHTDKRDKEDKRQTFFLPLEGFVKDL